MVDISDGVNIDMNKVGDAAANMGNTLALTIIIILIVVIIGGLILFVMWRRSYKFTIKIREVLSSDGHFLIIEDKAKRKIKDGVEYWKLRRRRALLTAPPTEAICLKSDGSYYAECFHFERSGLDSGYMWITPDKQVYALTSQEVNGKLRTKEEIDKDIEEVCKTPFRDNFKASLQQEERALLIERIRRANDRRSKSLLDTIMQITGLLFCIIIVVCLMAFYGEISKNIKETSAQVEITVGSVSNLLKEQAKLQEAITRSYEVFSGKKLYNYTTDIPLDQQVVG